MTKPTCAAAVKAPMTNILLGLGLMAATLGLSAPAHACNARGEFCGRPTWAANAFSGPNNRVPEAASDNKRYQATHHSKPVKTKKVVTVKKVVPLVKFEKVIKKVPLVKFADGFGRQFDPTSKVWFDGRSQCFSGKEQFTFKNNAWSYGGSKWKESNGIWKTTSADVPQLVSCQSVPTFAAKAGAFAAQTAKREESSKGAVEQPKTPPAIVPQVTTAEGETSEPGESAPAPTECKKYFPSIGQMLLVPCGE